MPQIHREIFLAVQRGDSQIVIETAALNARMHEVIGSIAVIDVVNGNEAIVFAPSLSRVRYQITRSLMHSGMKLKKIGASSYTLEETGGVLHFQQGTTFDPHELPVGSMKRMLIVDAHSIQTDLPTVLPHESSVLAGVFADVDHWFYDVARSDGASLHRFDAEKIVRAFPEQEEQKLPATDPYYRRRILLEDVAPDWGSSSFIRFARDRLKIRSDKPFAILSRKQKEEASLQHGTPVVSFEISPLQRRYLAAKRLARIRGNRPWFILLKYRRGGFTTIEQGLSYHVCTVRPRSSVITLAHTRDSTRRIFRIASLYHELDPQAQKLVSESKTALEFENGSAFFIGTAGGRGVARGDTLDRVHGSEVSKWCEGPNQMDQVQDLVAGLLGAASNGEVVLESTPNGREWFCNAYNEAKRGVNDYTPIFLRWFDDPMNRAAPGTYNEEEIRETLDAKEQSLIEKHGLDFAQISFRRTAQKTYGKLFLQEMPEDDASCFISSGTCFFDVEIILAMLEAGLKAPIREKKHGEYGYERVWEEPVEGVEYVGGVDTSEGLPGCDLAGIGILRRDTGEQVFSLHGYFDPRRLADQVARVGRAYNNALIGIERQNHGHAVLQRVKDLGYHKPHFRGGPLYYHQKAKGDIRDSRPGWDTNPQTRPLMLDGLAEAVEQNYMGINDYDMLQECLSFRLQVNGKFEADAGAHDDAVMKWAIAWQMYSMRRSKPSIAVG